MRLNKYLAASTTLSRRAADQAITDGRVTVNGLPVTAGVQVAASDRVTLDGNTVTPRATTTTIMLNKPVGYVCSRDGQGSQTVYDLLPHELHHLKPVGRLDKDSAGLLLMSDDGELAQALTHPKYQKVKRYLVKLHKQLTTEDSEIINDRGVELDDGLSRLNLKHNGAYWQIEMSEGRNRQIRRTFAALGYSVTSLYRTDFGPYTLGDLKNGAWRTLAPDQSE